MMQMSAAAKTASNAAVNLLSRSRIKNESVGAIAEIRFRQGCPRPGARSGCARSTGYHASPGRSLAGRTRSKPPASARHIPRRTSRNAQVNGHRAALLVSRRQSAAAFGTKRPAELPPG
jgi:hypothetical protein